MYLFILLFLFVSFVNAEEVKIEQDGMIYNANLSLVQETMPERMVVLVHGAVGHNAMPIIKDLEKVLNENGFSTLAINLSLGISNRHGKLSCDITHAHKHSQGVKEIDMWVNWLQEKSVKTFDLVGHSRGGNHVAWYAGDCTEDKIGKVVVLAAMLWNYEAEVQKYEKNHDGDLGAVLFAANILVEEGNGDHILEGIGFQRCKNANVEAATFVDYYADDLRKNTAYQLMTTNKPSLAIYGTEDFLYKSAQNIMPMVARGRADMVEVIFIEGGNHFFAGEEIFATMSSEVINFLNK